ncbi:hypothetical protein [Gluconobacter kondonii]|uniref:Uncharacterized protein n=1 Tax=Gluconobacter kondonii TaxID=941463 RepID=A0ABQ5WVC9_9PROT|nr:hypothetical protein [Gluconobacter kondonii]GBR41762.1 hypothetical protein AA3266_2857 [Gluconobacter kondonii NBRC 3266]GLQ67446.1 hypothetical protein GCM10007870_30310 [Gluconobacter kondonii]
MTDQAILMAPDEASLKAQYISALERFVDDTNAIHKAVEADLCWFPDMLALAGRARVIAEDLERKQTDSFDPCDFGNHPV